MSSGFKIIENEVYDALVWYLKREAWGLFVATCKYNTAIQMKGREYIRLCIYSFQKEVKSRICLL